MAYPARAIGDSDSGRRDAPGTARGDLNAAITSAVVRIYRSNAGRGPTRGRTISRDNVILVLMHDVMTTAERSLLADGRHRVVSAMRRQVHAMMNSELKAAVEELTGRTVTALMTDTSGDPDMAAELFVLDQPPKLS